MHTISIFLAQYLIFGILVLAVGYWLLAPAARKLRLIISGGITAAVGGLLAVIGSHAYYDPRPFVGGHVQALIGHTADNGFPSDHTLLAMVVALSVCMVSRRFGAILVVLAALVAAGRVLVHVHHPLDVIASTIFALVGALVAWWVTPHIERRLERKPAAL